MLEIFSKHQFSTNSYFYLFSSFGYFSSLFNWNRENAEANHNHKPTAPSLHLLCTSIPLTFLYSTIYSQVFLGILECQHFEILNTAMPLWNSKTELCLHQLEVPPLGMAFWTVWSKNILLQSMKFKFSTIYWTYFFSFVSFSLVLSWHRYNIYDTSVIDWSIYSSSMNILALYPIKVFQCEELANDLAAQLWRSGYFTWVLNM